MTTNTESVLRAARSQTRTKRRFAIPNNWELYLFALPLVLYYVIFHYVPLYGLQIAFKNFLATKGIWGSDWVGLEHFQRFFHSYYFWTLIQNTLGISLYELAVGFPVPILLALAINELRNGFFKRFAQTVTYAPHFISVVVISGMIISFLSPSKGVVNHFIEWLGFDPIPFMSEPGWFKSIFVLSGVWQNAGWGTIIYLAVLTSVDPQHHESAMIDGASKWQRVWHINLPSVVPTMIILLILNVGQFMAVGFEKIYLLQNQLNLDSSEIISTYVYKSGLLQAQYSFATAIGLFNAIINFILLLAVNRLARRAGETSLW